MEKLQEDQKASLERSSRYKVCQDPTPFANKTGCMSCSENSANLFDMTELKCIGCRDNETYNSRSYRCESTMLLNNFNAGKFINLPDSLDNLLKSQKTQTDSSPRYKVCDEQTPYVTKDGCTSCKDAGAPLFDFSTSKCAACTEKSIYNSRSSRCEVIVMLTNLTANKIVDLTDSMESLEKEQQAKLDSSPRYKVCSDPTPYYNGSECIACTDKSKPLFSFKYGKCGNCRRNTWYDKQARKCLKERTFEFVTDLQSKNLILNDTIRNLQRLQDDILKLRPTARVCPPEQPYSNGP